MLPTLFLSANMAKKYLAQNKKQRILILGASEDILTTTWLELMFPNIFKKPAHQIATFSFFNFTRNDFNLIHQSLAHRTTSSGSRWENSLGVFLEEMVELAHSIIADDDSMSFGSALDRIGFDLSFDGFIKCAFDGEGKVKAFRRTLQGINIHSVADTQRVICQEHYQYITMQISSVFQEHKSRLSSPLLIDMNRVTLSAFDAVVVVKEEHRHANWKWQKDARLLLNLTLDIPHIGQPTGAKKTRLAIAQ